MTTATPPDTFLAVQTLLAKHLPGYRRREQQEALAAAIEQVFAAPATDDGAPPPSRRLMAQAGTGTGKSLGALIPAILATVRSVEGRVIVGTSTIALMNQYLHSDLPFLQEVLGGAGIDFSYAGLKGIANFLCLAKLNENPEIAHLATLLEEIAPDEEGDFTGTGDRDDIQTPIDQTTEWPLVSSTSDECPGKNKCAMAEKCFGLRHKAEAHAADVVVTNTAIVMTDLKLYRQIEATSPDGLGKHVLLGDFDRLIIDEAHELPATATNHLGFELRQGGLIKWLDQVVVFLNLQGGADAGAQGQQEKVLGYLDAVGAIIGKEMGKEEKLTLGDAFIAEHFTLFENFYTELYRMTTMVNEVKVERGSKERQGDTKARLFAQGTNYLIALKEVLSAEEDKTVRWAEIYGRKKQAAQQQEIPLADPEEHAAFRQALVAAAGTAMTLRAAAPAVNQLAADYTTAVERQAAAARGQQSGPARWVFKTAPIEVGPILSRYLWSQAANGAVAMSATLSTGSGDTRFNYMARNLGLEGATTLDVGTPFDYTTQALIFVPPHTAPSPGQKTREEWETWMPEAMRELLRISGGGAMALFTSRAAMNHTYQILAPWLEASGINAFLQGGGMTNREIADRFREDVDSVLFGLRSFMTGVDFQGRTNRLVIVDKLPFANRSDPIVTARENAILKRGGSPFQEMSIPEMTLVLEQAFGRLIRSVTDYGTVAILDSRLSSTGYGRDIMKALPSAPFTTSLGDVKVLYDAWENSPAMRGAA